LMQFRDVTDRQTDGRTDNIRMPLSLSTQKRDKKTHNNKLRINDYSNA